MSENNLEQWCAINFGYSATETWTKQTCGDSVLSRAQVFSETDENIARIQSPDQRLTVVRMMAAQLNLRHTTVHQILTNELRTRTMENGCQKPSAESQRLQRFFVSKNIRAALQLSLFTWDFSCAHDWEIIAKDTILEHWRSLWRTS